ncbi:CARDB domain-containing protein [Myceligenerans pegani]|uniref:Discoidin domain-containing protein n=1 Tax=Myceligenerans pegani TaxID=2776917 RepID=A0ABR9N6F6_9MICO|nr:CARDB domain-containing protein [Myceligenerans sp. TRM 65318]MBE1878739.1 discoidin domain-containing protein [Myceligenerans sp. TRM 65318]MBE3021010.1 discoidin domain-containing protein [Myceligenerans sp. TRM 65318]
MRIPWKHTVVAGAAVALVAPLGVASAAHAADATNLALGKPITASSVTQNYVASNANDGNTGSYWEGAGGQYPSHLTVDLGQEAAVERVVVTLPPPDIWSPRTQTFSVLGRSDGESSFRTLEASAAYGFDPASGNRVEIPLAAEVDELRLAFSANTGAGNGQVSELEVWGTPTGDDPTDPPTEPTGPNRAEGRPVTASSTQWTYVASNAVDGQVGTYWEGAGGQYPSTLDVSLAAPTTLSSVRLRLDPDPVWGPRTQTFSIWGRSGTASWQELVPSAGHAFASGSGNLVDVAVSGTVTDLRLRFTGNTGAGNGQVAELEVYGELEPNPDLTVTEVTAAPASPDATTPVTLTATVENTGDRASEATVVDATVGGSAAGSADLAALDPGASTRVEIPVGTHPAGEHTVGAVVDPEDLVTEHDETNNALTSPEKLVIDEAPGPDLEVVSVSANPSAPAAGDDVTFAVKVRNRGNEPVAAGSVTRVVVGSSTLDGTTPAVGAGETVTVTPDDSWTATDGGVTATATADATDVVDETDEGNNTGTLTVTVGRGAAVPYTTYEAEDGEYTGELLQTDPLRTFGHTNFATESSGRESVRLTGTGQYVEFTSTTPTNSIVVRNSIPDAPGGGGQDKTISLYADGEFVQKLTFSSRHSWLYGTTDAPEGLTNTPGGDARRLFDESHALLGRDFPAGTVFRLQRDADDDAQFYILDLIELEQVAPPRPKPAQCTSITEYGAVPDDGIEDTDAIQAAVTADQEGEIDCVWIPAGRWRQERKILTEDPGRNGYNQVGIRDVTIRGAGMWHSQLYSLIEPQDADGINHPHEGNFGFDIDAGVQISDIAIFGSGRIRGGDGNDEGGVGLNGRFGEGTRISNVWIEHANVGVWVGRDYSNKPELWGPADGLQFSGMRIRNTYADGINFSNGTRNSSVVNSTFRNTGDDALAVWANPYVKDTSVDIAHDNTFRNNTVQLPWRANGIAIYGGYDNTIENNLIYDTMNYPGIMLATDHSPLPFSGTTLVAGNGLYRTGGAFWNEDQEFGAITLFPQTHDIVGVTIRDTEIVDSTYDGIQFKNGGGNMPDVRITNVRIDRSNNGSGILAMGGARGNAILSGVTVRNSAEGDIETEPGSTFRFTGQ